ncbi:hypothetical protein SeMB42_g04259 [Synchytrium endobioticum]|uniref:SEC7 domain-containing protein n=1 Tax=Synchytrium endobioticum TaxID=286115 RepID=A0A507CZS5_9FUNG|nr:hypothetical protein SeMB42_g04259 [Synchytrium endobioticum]
MSEVTTASNTSSLVTEPEIYLEDAPNRKISSVFAGLKPSGNRKLKTSTSSSSLKVDGVAIDTSLPPTTSNAATPASSSLMSPVSALLSRFKTRDPGPRSSNHQKGFSISNHPRSDTNDVSDTTAPVPLAQSSTHGKKSKRTHKRNSSLPIRHVASLDALIAHAQTIGTHHAQTHIDLSTPPSPTIHDAQNNTYLYARATESVKGSTSSLLPGHDIDLEAGKEAETPAVGMSLFAAEHTTTGTAVSTHAEKTDEPHRESDIPPEIVIVPDHHDRLPSDHDTLSTHSIIPTNEQQTHEFPPRNDSLPVIPASFKLPQSQPKQESLSSITDPQLQPPQQYESVMQYLVDAVTANMQHSNGASLGTILESPSGMHKPLSGAEKAIQNDTLATIRQHVVAEAGRNVDRGNASALESTPVPGLDYKTMNPTEVARLLLENSLPDVPADDVAFILGKQDPFHCAVLAAFMNNFDFAGTKLEESFRQFCAHVTLKGETQMQDRILMRVAQRYWDCNPQSWSMYYSVDIIHIILFSMVMLNTDLSHANKGSIPRMTKADYIKNTIRTIDTLLPGLSKSEESERASSNVTAEDRASMDKDASEDRERRRKLEIELRDLYKAISRHNIVSRATCPDHLAPSPSNSSLPFRLSNSTLRREGSSLSLSTTHSSSSAATNFDNMSISSGRSQWAIMTLRRRNNGSSGALDRGSTMDRKSVLSALSGNSLGRTTTGSDGQEYSSTSSLRSGSIEMTNGNVFMITSAYGPDSGRGGACQGLIIRKKLLDSDGNKARNRRWVKAWATLRVDNIMGVELTLQKVESDSDKFSPTEIGGGTAGDSAAPQATIFAGTSTVVDPNVGRRSMAAREARSRPAMESSRPTRVLRIAANIETIPLLHSIAIPHPDPGYSASRPFVLSLHLNDGSTSLIQVPTASILNMWARAINYWAARRSREPLRGGIGNAQFGWNGILLERRARQAEERERQKERRTHGRRGESSSISMTAKEAAAAASMVLGDEFEFGTKGVRALVGDTGSIGSSIGLSGVGGKEGLLSQPNDQDDGTKIKIVEWTPPANPINTRPGGDFTELCICLGFFVEQLNAMRRQLEIVGKDLEEHSSLREAMEIKFGAQPSQRDKAAKNWKKKQLHLTYEHQKYAIYIEALVQGSEYITSGADHVPSTFPRKRITTEASGFEAVFT